MKRIVVIILFLGAVIAGYSVYASMNFSWETSNSGTLLFLSDNSIEISPLA